MEQLFTKIGSSLKLSQQVQNQIEELIRNKKLLPGQKLPTEKELCDMFGVSRTALREAIQMLSAKGLISVRKGSGIYVNDYDSSTATDFISLYLDINFEKDAILHVMQVRMILEPDIARLAALNRSREDLETLRLNIEKFKKCDDNRALQLGRLDREFHLTIAKATGNPLIPVIVDPIFRLMPKIRSLVYARIDTAESAALEFHHKIYDCIERQDVAAAYNTMAEHMHIAEEHSKEVLKDI